MSFSCLTFELNQLKGKLIDVLGFALSVSLLAWTSLLLDSLFKSLGLIAASFLNLGWLAGVRAGSLKSDDVISTGEELVCEIRAII
jgi:hypothetical protein